MIAPKGGRPKQFTAEQARERNKESRQRHRKRKREEHAALEARAKKAEDELKSARADNVKLTGIVVQAAVEIRRARERTRRGRGR